MTALPRTDLSPKPRLVAARQRPTLRVGTPLLSVVIVNYRQWANTERLVGQLLRSKPARHGLVEVVVVDNDSPAHPARARLRRLGGVSLRCLGRNRGFGRGVNEGVRLSRGGWFLLLNPDVTVDPEFLERALDATHRREPRTGIIGVRLSDPGGNVQGSAGFDPTFLDTLLGQLRPRDERKCRLPPAAQRRRVPWVTGCGLLVRRDCFEALGGFDREFFLYYEDADLGRRARAAGWDVCHEPGLEIVHHHPLHGREVSPRLRLLTRHALLTYARKHWQPAALVALAGVVWLEALVRGCFTRDRKARRAFRTTRAVAIDVFSGNHERAYRRVWNAAQRGRAANDSRPRRH
jgi:N-acetylglucosaminyl-diphospho-decaprenol L-rhamnosyltransferase